MNPEELAVRVLNDSDITDYSKLNADRFSPFLQVEFNKDTYVSGKYTVYRTILGSCSLRLRNISLFMTIRSENFSIDEWHTIPKKLKKGLSRLHDKGQLIPLINTITLL